MIFPSTTDKLQLITTSAADLDVICDYADMDNSTKAVTVGRQLTKITTAATTDVLAAPASGFSRKLKYMSINNVHASTSNTVTLQYNANGTAYKTETWIINAAERVAFVEGRGFRPLDSQGREEESGAPQPTGSATTSQIAAHSADTYYLGLNVGNRVQAGSWFRWTFGATKGAAGTTAPTFIIRYGTAGSTADTARVTMTGAQTAVADSGLFQVDATFRATGASAVLQGRTWIDNFASATTGFKTTAATTLIEATSGTFDSTPANSIIGLSVNPGASGAWVVNLVTVEAFNLLT